MSCEGDTALAIRDGGRRFTEQRLRVATALRHANGHRTVDEIHALVGGDGAMPLSTVYRALGALKAMHLIGEVEAGSRAAFEWVDADEPHYHLVCEDCGGEQPLNPRLIERLRTRIASDTGFEAHLDHFAVRGHCRGCRDAARGDATRSDARSGAGRSGAR